MAEPNVQVNVRLPPALRDAIDERRAILGENGISRDEWCRRALAWALAQPPGPANRAGIARTPTGRTANPRPSGIQ